MKFTHKKLRLNTMLSLFLSCYLIGLSNPASAFLAGKRDRDYHETCKTGVLSPQQKSYCDQAQIARVNKTAETVKSVAFFAGAVAAGTIALLPLAGETMEAACKAIGYGLTGFGIATDAYVGIKNGEIIKSLVGSLVGVVGGFGISANLDKIPFVGGRLQEANWKSAECFGTSINLGIQGGKSLIGINAARTAFDSALGSAKTLVDTRGPRLDRTYDSGFRAPNPNTPQNPNRSAGNGGESDPAGEDPLCGSNTNYTACIKNTLPEVAAIMNSPGLMNEINKRLKGQSFEDFLKGYDSDKASPDAYVANAMGLPLGSVSQFAKNLDAAGKDSGAYDKYTPLTYSSSGPKPASVGGDLDFSKMMADMLKQMNPDGTQKTGDPAELVFRQLDLLPAEKIEARKDISLFARIGYRYRKKSNDVEQLSWANEANQTLNNAPIGRVPATSR